MTGAVRRTLVIGITGPIGCGKSTVARWLSTLHGGESVDADQVARDVLAPGTTEVEDVYARFGSDLRRPDGSLDRAALGRVVFSDPRALAVLEGIVHPAVRERILAAIELAKGRGAEAVVIEAVKLVEGGLADMCDEVWLVTCDPATQLERLLGRGEAEDDASARIAAQTDLEGRVRSYPRGIREIVTDGDPNATRATVIAAFGAALEAASPRA